jgi:hypothetical protein
MVSHRQHADPVGLEGHLHQVGESRLQRVPSGLPADCFEVLGQRLHLERDFGDDRQRAPCTAQQAVEVVARDAFDHLRAAFEGDTIGRHSANRQQSVAWRAEPIAPRACAVTAHNPADGRLLGQRGVPRQVLTVFPQQLLHGVQGHSRADG